MVLLELEEFDLFGTLIFVDGALLLMAGLKRLYALCERPYLVLVALLFILELLDLIFKVFLAMFSL